MTTDSTGLMVKNLIVKRDELPIVRDVSLLCPPGEVTVLLGANGAGKTTFLDAIAGVIPVAGGTVTLDGFEIQHLRKDRRATHGLAYVEQGRSIFPDLTVEENLKLATRKGAGYESAFELFPELKARQGVAAQLVSGGEQQMLVLARAIVSSPKVLLIDEMSQGLAPVIVKRLLPFVVNAADQGIAVLLVEQFASLALHFGDTAHVMTGGKIVLSGSCAELATDPERVRHAYLHGSSNSSGPNGQMPETKAQPMAVAGAIGQIDSSTSVGSKA
jgi:branched-chain amino acid transport system ATP-binding protein